MYITYALYNKLSNKIYIGQTADLEKRIKEHNLILPNKSKFTKTCAGYWQVFYTKKYVTRSEAMRREKQLKGYQGRKFLKNLVEYRNIQAPVAQRIERMASDH